MPIPNALASTSLLLLSPLWQRKYAVPSGFLANQREVTSHMRTILVDWLIQVHLRFKLLQETLYVAIAIMDRYLAVSTPAPRDSCTGTGTHVSMGLDKVLGLQGSLAGTSITSGFDFVIFCCVYTAHDLHGTLMLDDCLHLSVKTLWVTRARVFCDLARLQP